MLAQKDKTAASAAIFMSVRRTNVGRVLATMNWQVLAAGEAREGLRKRPEESRSIFFGYNDYCIPSGHT